MRIGLSIRVAYTPLFVMVYIAEAVIIFLHFLRITLFSPESLVYMRTSPSLEITVDTSPVFFPCVHDSNHQIGLMLTGFYHLLPTLRVVEISYLEKCVSGINMPGYPCDFIELAI